MCGRRRVFGGEEEREILYEMEYCPFPECRIKR